MSSLVMVVVGSLLPAILPCHAIQLGFAEGKAGVPSKRAASESGRKAKRRRAAALQKGHLRKPPCMGAPFGSVGHRNLEYRIVRAQARVRTLLTFPWPFSWDFTNDSALSGCAEAVYRLGLAVGAWGICNTEGTKGRAQRARRKPSLRLLVRRRPEGSE